MDNAKYIIVDSPRYGEYPIIFPMFIDHSTMAYSHTVISAGFVHITGDDYKALSNCFGESTTLKLKSRQEEDSRLVDQLLRIGKYSE